MSKPTMLRVMIKHDARKLSLPFGIPDSVEELERAVKEELNVPDSFVLHYLDTEFGDFFSLTSTATLKDKDTIKVVFVESVFITLTAIDCPQNISTSSSDVLSTVSSVNSSDVSSVQHESSDDTVLLSPLRSQGLRSQHWPAHFDIPEFPYDTELTLQTGNDEFLKNGVLLNNHSVRSQISDTLVKKIFQYCAYPSSNQVCAVAQALIEKYPCLREPGSLSGYDGWLSRLKNKMATYRKKLKQLGCPELAVNSSQNKRPAAIKKPRKAELNYLPPLPSDENKQTLERLRIELLSDIKVRDNRKAVSEKMARTFSSRRQEIVEDSPPVHDLLQRWPALFDVTQVKEEFRRLTAIDLESQLYSNLDKYTDRLLSLYHSKGGNAARKMQDLLILLDQDAGVDNRRDVVIRGLMVHFSENVEHLITHYQDTHGDLNPDDLKNHTLKIVTKGGSADGSPLEAGIVLEGTQVMAGLQSVPNACVILLGLMYVINLSYPKPLRYTFEFFQKVLLELDSGKLSPKMLSLKNNLLA
ncbi:uncharacterized protein [Paramormyrops kingsleyae]|uniref:uncharacterized protein n=1 Tax=Paramormyrops kingsleyae TaxID=1676925 RepID=UPI003B96E9C2